MHCLHSEGDGIGGDLLFSAYPDAGVDEIELEDYQLTPGHAGTKPVSENHGF